MENINLTPTIPEFHEKSHYIYINALNRAIKEKGVNNIALTGPYGSGKSSIIRKFIENKNIKYTIVSLPAFKSSEVGDQKTQKSQDFFPTSCELQKEILKQLLYSVPPEELPDSKFNRISVGKDLNIVQKLALAIALWGILWAVGFPQRLFSLFSPISGLIERFTNSLASPLPIPVITEPYWAMFFVYIFCLFTIFRILKISIFRKFMVSSMQISGLEIKNEENSYFDEHLDEIIYFFDKTNTRIVIFEDLDRHGSSKIFEELHSLNYLINNRNLNYEIKFIYAVKDSLLEDSVSDVDLKSKFFDISIPVRPFVSGEHMGKYVIKNINKNLTNQEFRFEKFDLQLIGTISKYVPESRTAINIANSFSIYYAVLSENPWFQTDHDRNINTLLALCLLRNCDPKLFESLTLPLGIFSTDFLTPLENIRQYFLNAHDHEDSFSDDNSCICGSKSGNFNGKFYDYWGIYDDCSDAIIEIYLSDWKTFTRLFSNERLLFEKGHNHYLLDDADITNDIQKLEKFYSLHQLTKDLLISGWMNENFGIFLWEVQTELRDIRSISFLYSEIDFSHKCDLIIPPDEASQVVKEFAWLGRPPSGIYNLSLFDALSPEIYSDSQAIEYIAQALVFDIDESLEKLPQPIAMSDGIDLRKTGDILLQNILENNFIIYLSKVLNRENYESIKNIQKFILTRSYSKYFYKLLLRIALSEFTYFGGDSKSKYYRRFLTLLAVAEWVAQSIINNSNKTTIIFPGYFDNFPQKDQYLEYLESVVIPEDIKSGLNLNTNKLTNVKNTLQWDAVVLTDIEYNSMPEFAKSRYTSLSVSGYKNAGEFHEDEDPIVMVRFTAEADNGTIQESDGEQLFVRKDSKGIVHAYSDYSGDWSPHLECSESWWSVEKI